jgi:hypothetical protein
MLSTCFVLNVFADLSQVDAGVDKDLVFGDPTAPRFVFWEKKLRATPSGPDALTFDLLSIWGKIRAGLGAVGIVKGGPMPGDARHLPDCSMTWSFEVADVVQGRQAQSCQCSG